MYWIKDKVASQITQFYSSEQKYFYIPQNEWHLWFVIKVQALLISLDFYWWQSGTANIPVITITFIIDKD